MIRRLSEIAGVRAHARSAGRVVAEAMTCPTCQDRRVADGQPCPACCCHYCGRPALRYIWHIDGDGNLTGWSCLACRISRYPRHVARGRWKHEGGWEADWNGGWLSGYGAIGREESGTWSALRSRDLRHRGDMTLREAVAWCEGRTG